MAFAQQKEEKDIIKLYLSLKVCAEYGIDKVLMDAVRDKIYS